ncbi:MAG: hypothetical protein KDC33_12395, partial [Thermoleophilia bacterium]|nr:hypothetical protein [Thermoleophilia bacterium]
MSSGARQVLLLADTRALERPLDYSVPDALGDVPPGTLVACPLGPRRLIGVVVGGGPPTYDGTLQPLAGVVDTPPVPPELMDLALWTARYYAAPVSPCVRLVLPPGAEGALRRGADGQWGLAAPPRGPAPRWVARVVPG